MTLASDIAALLRDRPPMGQVDPVWVARKVVVLDAADAARERTGRGINV